MGSAGNLNANDAKINPLDMTAKARDKAWVMRMIAKKDPVKFSRMNQMMKGLNRTVQQNEKYLEHNSRTQLDLKRYGSNGKLLRSLNSEQGRRDHRSLPPHLGGPMPDLEKMRP